jgi:hypothetical protein
MEPGEHIGGKKWSKKMGGEIDFWGRCRFSSKDVAF